MKWIALILVVGTTLAGCSTHARTSGEGSALPREAVSPPLADRELIPESPRHPSHYWSVRDFMQPRGLIN